MKRLIFSIFLFFSFFKIFAVEIPESLYGIWEGKDRIVFFEQEEILIILKEYYGWYYDRAAEPKEYADKEVRTRNSATTRKAEQITIDEISTNINASDSTSGILKLQYSSHQSNYIPFCIVNENMYLNFLEQNNDIPNYYKGVSYSKGFLVSEQSIPENITGFYIDNDKLYDIRYWKSDMDYSTETAKLSYNDFEVEVPKHILSGSSNYSCVSGRSKIIRNVVAPTEYKEENFIFNQNKSILIRDSEPYLTKIADKKTFEDLMQMVKTANARRKPDPKPLFPPNDVNWHWDIIDRLEANNELIQAVRARQRAFGPRAKDINN